MSDSSKRLPLGLNVLKRSGAIEPFDKNKLVNSIKKAGATPKQAALVSDRVENRLGGFKQAVPSSQLSTMVARSLGQVNPKASSQYTTFRDLKQRSPLAPTTKGAFFAARPSAVQTATLRQVAPAAVGPTSTLRPAVTAKPTMQAAAVPPLLRARGTSSPAIIAASKPAAPTAPLQSLPPDSDYQRIAAYLSTNFGSSFSKGASTDEIEMQLTKILRENIAPRGGALQGFKKYIALRQYGDLVR